LQMRAPPPQIRQTTPPPPPAPRPPPGAFPFYMRQHANTIAKATVNGVFASVPGLKNAARANFAGALPPDLEDTWNRIGNFPWQPGHRNWQQPYCAPPS
jgi:hypothetical protein